MIENDFSNSELYETCYGYKEQSSTRRFILIVLALFLCLLGLRLYVYYNFVLVDVSGPSMKNTLQHGEKLLMERVDDNDKAKRGDVIVVDVRGYEEFASSSTKFLIKRLIAIEGDKLYCKDGVIYICYAGQNEYVSLKEEYAYYLGDKSDYDFIEYTVKKGEIFFLGDNRQNSQDSRYKQEGGSRINRLYKVEDIYGVVPQWAIKYQKALEWTFFR